jgi:hypothetical protein
MRDGIVEAFLAKVDKDIRDSARLLVGKRRGWDAYNFLRDLLPAVTPPSQKEIAQANEAIHQAARNGHDGGVKVARKRRMGLLPAVDPAGKTWKPDHKSPLDPAIFPKWGRVPVYVPPLVGYMNRIETATIVLIGEVVDRKGRFKLARATHAAKANCSERKAYAALETLRDAGLIKADIPGDRNQATIWRYAPVAEVDLAKATKILQEARRRATADLKDREVSS